MARHNPTRSHHDDESAGQRRGLTVILMLAVLTAIEFVFAIAFDAAAALVVSLTAVALVKAWLIVMYFMHLPRVWQGEEA